MAKANIAETDKHVCEVMMDYALSMGCGQINKLPGLWESVIDENWTIRCNGHDKTIKGVPPYCWSIEYNGWPAGILSIMGEGVICAGELGNAENLIEAIEAKMAKNAQAKI
jgi:hypothetical protein